jgi:hypothetical protein
MACMECPMTGEVFVADLSRTGSIVPIVELRGAKIGFNPQDRFMVAIQNTLIVITQAGEVFGANIIFESVATGGPFAASRAVAVDSVFPIKSPKIGFSPVDRFMVAIGNTLSVVTKVGGVFGAEVDPGHRKIGDVFSISGPQIGFNPEDRFMVGGFLFPKIIH